MSMNLEDDSDYHREEKSENENYADEARTGMIDDNISPRGLEPMEEGGDSPHPDEENGPTSSMENIIPPQLRKGFGVFYNWAAATAVVVKDKAIEINNSEAVQEYKQKAAVAVQSTVDAATPMWETTKAKAAPYWEMTKESVSTAVEKTRETTSRAAESMRPAITSVSNQISESAVAGFQSFNEVASKWFEPEQSDKSSQNSRKNEGSIVV